jgi:hypothetical protein
MIASTWVAWCAVTAAFGFANSLNSRAKNSRSWLYCALTSAAVAGLYILSMLGVGNIILKSSNDMHTLVAAVITYMAMSTIGSVAGQEIALKYFKKAEDRTT